LLSLLLFVFLVLHFGILYFLHKLVLLLYFCLIVFLLLLLLYFLLLFLPYNHLVPNRSILFLPCVLYIEYLYLHLLLLLLLLVLVHIILPFLHFFFLPANLSFDNVPHTSYLVLVLVVLFENHLNYMFLLYFLEYLNSQLKDDLQVIYFHSFL